MTVEVRDPRFREVVGDDAPMERLGTGFAFTEGPVWHPVERHLIFSDMPGDHMRRWSEADGVTTFRQPANKANGNAYDPAGRLVTCEHATSRVTRTEPDGTLTVLATHWEGRELNSPNDIVVKRDGAIYFTDPNYGRREYFGVPREQELDFQGVYRIAPDGTLSLLADDFAQPNGLSFDGPEARLFVNDTEGGHIRVFDVAADGGVTGGGVWAEVTGEGAGAPDGMKTDSEDKRLLHRPRRSPRVRSGRDVPRGHPGAGGRRQLHVGRRGLAEPFHHRFDFALPDPRPGPGPPRLLATHAPRPGRRSRRNPTLVGRAAVMSRLIGLRRVPGLGLALGRIGRERSGAGSPGSGLCHPPPRALRSVPSEANGRRVPCPATSRPG